jgi:hypothetical protein
MITVTNIKTPIIQIDMELPRTTILMETPTKHDYYAILQGDSSVLQKYALTEIPPFTDTTLNAFIDKFVEWMNEYRKENMDFLAIPEKETFGKDQHEDTKLPIITHAENLVYEHSGLNFVQQLDLPITEYWLLLADAVKLRLLQRVDGIEYLNECYNSMHRISTLSPKLRG